MQIYVLTLSILNDVQVEFISRTLVEPAGVPPHRDLSLHLWRRNEASLISPSRAPFCSQTWTCGKSPLAGGGGDADNARVASCVSCTCGNPLHSAGLRVSEEGDHLVLMAQSVPSSHPLWKMASSSIHTGGFSVWLPPLAEPILWQRKDPSHHHTSRITHIHLIAGVLHINCSVPGASIICQALTLG